MSRPVDPGAPEPNLVVQFRLTNGLCHACGTRIHDVTEEQPSKRRKITPLNIPGVVREGRCLFCYPDHEETRDVRPDCPVSNPDYTEASSAAASLPTQVARHDGEDTEEPAAKKPAPVSPQAPIRFIREDSTKKPAASGRIPVPPSRLMHFDEDTEPATASTATASSAAFSMSSTSSGSQKHQTPSAVTVYDAHGSAYSGLLTAGNIHKGQGTFECVFAKGDELEGKTSVYKGEIVNGKFEGKGWQRDAAGCVYEGEFKDGASHGYGTCVWPKGWVYEGEWVSDLRQGKGTCRQTKQSGEVYSGMWKNDQWHGEGELKFAGGGSYKGEFKADKIHGKGVYHFVDGSCYKGWFKNDLREGQGTITYADGIRYVGNWRSNWRDGVGTCYYPDGSIFKGYFVADERTDGYIETPEDGILRRVKNGSILT